MLVRHTRPRRRGADGVPDYLWFIPVGTSAACRYYRGCALAEVGSRLGFRVDLATSRADVYKGLERRPRALILYRTAWSPWLNGVLTRARRNRVVVGFDTDDVVVEPAYSPIVAGYRLLSEKEREHYDEGVSRYRETVHRVDFVTASTPYLIQVLRRYNSHAMLLANIHTQETWAKRRGVDRSNIRPTVAYFSGTRTHDADFSIAAKALLTVLRERRDLILRIVGDLSLPPAFRDLADQIDVRPAVPFEQLYNAYAGVSLVICPLERDPFCNGKSHVKYSEAALGGAAAVVSDVPAYRVVTTGRDGLVARTEQEWLDGLRLLVNFPEKRAAIAQQAQLLVAAQLCSSSDNIKQQFMRVDTLIRELRM